MNEEGVVLVRGFILSMIFSIAMLVLLDPSGATAFVVGIACGCVGMLISIWMD